jgi:protein-disulfide isomerase
MNETIGQRPSGPLGTWIAVVGAVATAALGLSIASLVMNLQGADDAGAPPSVQAGAESGQDAGDTALTDAGDETPPAQPAEAEQPAASLDPREVAGVPIAVGGAAAAEVPTTPAVRIDTFFDFMCPYCAQFEQAYGTQLQQMVDGGQIVLVQHPVAILDQFSMGTNYSSRAASAAYAVANGAPEVYSAFVEGLFASQPEENTEGLTDEQIVETALSAGVPAEVTEMFWPDNYLAMISEITADATNSGVTGTPTVMISTPDTTPEKWDYQTSLDQLVAQKAGQ